MKTLATILAVGGSLLSACGADVDYNKRQDKAFELDAKPRNQVYLEFQLPDRQNFRDDAPSTTAQIDAYYFRLEGRGSECPTASELHEGQGLYQDRVMIGVKVSALCDYEVTLKLGQVKPALRLAESSEISFETHIKPIMQASCASCHPTWTDLASFEGRAKDLVAAVESQTMPPEQPLSDREIALFLAWADGGFLAASAPSKTPSPLEASLGKVFYRNNNNDILPRYELFGVQNKELRRSLWIQDDGLAAGLRTRQLYTFGASEPSGNP